MGHLISKSQHLLPPATLEHTPTASFNTQSTEKNQIVNTSSTNEQQQLLTSHRPLVLSSSPTRSPLTKPTSVIITIRMLKMEPNDHQLNNLNPNLNCYCNTQTMTNHLSNSSDSDYNCVCHLQHDERLIKCAHSQTESIICQKQRPQIAINAAQSDNFNIIVSDVNNQNNGAMGNGENSENHIVLNNNALVEDKINLNCNSHKNNNVSVDSVADRSVCINSPNLHSKNTIVCDKSKNYISNIKTNNPITMADTDDDLSKVSVADNSCEKYIARISDSYKISNVNISVQQNLSKFKDISLNVPIMVDDEQQKQYKSDVANLGGSGNRNRLSGEFDSTGLESLVEPCCHNGEYFFS